MASKAEQRIEDLEARLAALEQFRELVESHPGQIGKDLKAWHAHRARRRTVAAEREQQVVERSAKASERNAAFGRFVVEKLLFHERANATNQELQGGYRQWIRQQNLESTLVEMNNAELSEALAALPGTKPASVARGASMFGQSGLIGVRYLATGEDRESLLLAYKSQQMEADRIAKMLDDRHASATVRADRERQIVDARRDAVLEAAEQHRDRQAFEAEFAKAAAAEAAVAAGQG